MAHRLRTPEGKKLYALRKQAPEPVFGIIKSVLGFRQFSMCGLEKARGEWSLVTMAGTSSAGSPWCRPDRRRHQSVNTAKASTGQKSWTKASPGLASGPIAASRPDSDSTFDQRHQSDRLLAAIMHPP